MIKRIAGYDGALVLATLGIVGLSVYLLTTAITNSNGSIDAGYGVKQGIFALIGFGLAIGVSRISLERFEERWLAVYGFCVGSILAVFMLGSVARGSRRWISLGFINLQPSEIGKILAVLAVAAFVAARIRDIESPKMVGATLGLMAIPAGLVFIQPDLGTSIMYGVGGISLLYFAGARWLHIGGLFAAIVTLAVLVVVVLPVVGIHVLDEYQVERLTGFANPDADPQRANYHSTQSKIAIGSGEMWGKSAEEATQVNQSFLPEPHTDFIFATLCERHGVVGGALLLALFALLISRCLAAAATAPTLYGRLVCGAVATILGAQVFINVGMTIGIMPITGVPLPLFSYGGSALLANLIGVGLVAGVLRSSESASVRARRRVRSVSSPSPFSTLTSSTASDRRRRVRPR